MFTLLYFSKTLPGSFPNDSSETACEFDSPDQAIAYLRKHWNTLSIQVRSMKYDGKIIGKSNLEALVLAH